MSGKCENFGIFLKSERWKALSLQLMLLVSISFYLHAFHLSTILYIKWVYHKIIIIFSMHFLSTISGHPDGSHALWDHHHLTSSNSPQQTIDYNVNWLNFNIHVLAWDFICYCEFGSSASVVSVRPVWSVRLVCVALWKWFVSRSLSLSLSLDLLITKFKKLTLHGKFSWIKRCMQFEM